MRHRTASVLVAAALLIGTTEALSQDKPDDPEKPQTPAKLCFKCKRTGKIPCTLHKTEDDVEFCSYNLTLPCCLGFGFTLCPKCKVEAAIEEWEALKQRRDAWLEARRKADKDAGEPLIHIETPHFRMAFGMRDVVLEDRRLDQHKGAHLYMSRLEATWKLYGKILDVKDEKADPKHEVYLYESLDSFHRAMKTMSGSGSTDTGFRVWGSRSIYVTWRDPGRTPGDQGVHGKVVHMAAHQLLDKYKTWKVHPPAWLDEGYALYMENALVGQMRTFCFVEVAPDSPWKSGNWRERILKDVSKRSNPSFAQVSAKELNAMDYEDMAYSYSFVDFLITKKPQGFPKFVDSIKSGKKTNDAIREALGWLAPEFEENWRAYVLTHYETK